MILSLRDLNDEIHEQYNNELAGTEVLVRDQNYNTFDILSVSTVPIHNKDNGEFIEVSQEKCLVFSQTYELTQNFSFSKILTNYYIV